jgi:hypothetical protein
MADILLSYERTDRQRVAPLVALLEACGWSVQWDPAGEANAHGPVDAACIIAAWSIDSVESEAVWAVASHGLASGILVSVSIDFSRPPQELGEAPSIALAGWTGDASSPRAQELVAAVEGLLAQALERAPKKAPEPAPTRSYAAPAAHLSEPAARATVEPPAVPAAPAAREVEVPGESAPGAQWPPAFDPEPEPPWPPAFPRQRQTQAGVEVDLDFQEPPPEPVPALILREGTTEPVWAFPEETVEEEAQRTPHLPPVLLRERGLPFRSHGDEAPAPPPAPRRSLAGPVIGLVAGLAIVVAAATFWATEYLASPPHGGETASVDTASEPDSKPAAKSAATPAVATLTPPVRPMEPKPPEAKPPEAKSPEPESHDAKPQEVQPTPAALPQDKDVGIEDILGQMTPRVEQLLADARTLIRIGDFRGARQVLTAPETTRSGLLTFLLAETYDPNVLPAAQKGTFADPGRAKALYRKAHDLGDGRAQARLDALKTS